MAPGARTTDGSRASGSDGINGADRGTQAVSIAEPARERERLDSASARRLEARLRRQVGRTIARYRMIEPGDRVMVCVSGGKDSFAMLDLLRSLQRSAPVPFELVAVSLNQKQPGYPAHVLPEYLSRLGVSFEIIEQDTYSVVKRVVPEGKTMCGLCSRLRRGRLYRYADENGISKIALGHHRDDIVETFFLNLFHGGRVAAMPPKLLSDDGKHVVIRPLSQCAERDLAAYARARSYPIIACNLCGSQAHLQRAEIKRMLAEWERRWPGRTQTLFTALSHVSPSQLADETLFDFVSLSSAAPGAVK